MPRLSLTAQRPSWASLSHPVLRTILQREQQRHTRAARALAAIVGVGMALSVLYFGVDAYRRDMSLGISGQNESPVFSVLYLFLLLMQLFAQLAALLLASSLFASERQREAWELVKITSHGAEFAVWARWAAVMYRLRWLLAAVWMPRLFFTVTMLAGLTDYHGRQLDLAIAGGAPALSIPVAIGLLAALMAATLLQPLVAVALNASAGLAIVALAGSGRLYQLVRCAAMAAQMIGFCAALAAGWIVLNGDPWTPGYATMAMGERWANLLLMAAGGDQGLRLMNLQTAFRAWTDVEYGALIGVALLAVVVGELMLAQGLARWAAYRAGRPGRG